MMTKTIAPIHRSACVTAIAARDFNQDTTDSLRDRWSPGALRHLIAAAKGQVVTIVLDARTGNAETGVTLNGVRQTPGYGTFQMLVIYRWGTGENDVNRTWHPVDKMGTILVHDAVTDDVRGKALRTYREEGAAAIEIGRKRLAAKYLDMETRGTWRCLQFADFVDVSFRPESYTSPVSFETWRLSLSELA